MFPMIPLRRGLLELWGMLVIASFAGFVGPFGTYENDPFFDRVAVWWAMSMGAYLLVRPLLVFLTRLAALTLFPARTLRFWGTVAVSAPIAVLWGAFGQDTMRAPNGFGFLASLALLCGLAVFGVAEWSQWADCHTRARSKTAGPDSDLLDAGLRSNTSPLGEVDTLARSLLVHDDGDADSHPRPPVQGTFQDSSSNEGAPPLLARLSPSFPGPVIALQSEDHYVRVHGTAGSELLLMRLCDAVTEMGNVHGDRVHRSWWVALSGVVGHERSGRANVLLLASGARAPVARGSVARLQRAGFLPYAIGVSRDVSARKRF